jgi:tRNA G10  N-methylase Trm11
MKSICILGRQPALGLAELEGLFGPDAIKPLGESTAAVNLEPSGISLERLGGTLKICKLLTYLPYTNWQKIENYLIESLPEHLGYIPEGKIKLGLSLYGQAASVRQLNTTGLKLKKLIKDSGRSVRVVPNSSPTLNTAQTIHNSLTGPNGLELVVIIDRGQAVLAQVKAVQDIAAYAGRDQVRPKRDSRVGMLPPKLAQIIVNLARPQPGATVLDPFCGTGVILQEAALMGYNVYGTDLETRMVDYTEANLDWLRVETIQRRVHQADATTAEWEEPFDTVATETYLGRPFSSSPEPEVLNEVIRDVDTIHRKFFANLSGQLKSGARLCLAVPAWKQKNGFSHLPSLDHLEKLGYTRTSFVHARAEDLIYYREGQIVGRELVTLVRK